MSQLKNIKVSSPTYSETIPSLNKKVKIKPFRVGDEKVLLLASESEDPKQVINALKSVIGNCVEGADVSEMAAFDLEYLFLKLRSISVGEETKIGLNCQLCKAENEVSVDISKVQIKKDKNHKSTVRVSDNLGFEMRYPDIEVVGEVQANDVEGMFDLIAHSIKTVFYDDETINVGDDEMDDLKNLINELTADQFREVQQFFETIPKLSHDIKFDCKECGKANSHKLEGLQSFF